MTNYRKLAIISLILVYLVITAGAVVRMTGSGMGCPDWPKCFGYLIPPTEEAELRWQPNKTYSKGQVIIRNEALWVAKADFMTEESYQKSNWEAYTKHEYAIFNPYHTWIEYINRLMGALAGLATLLLGFLSFSFFKKKRQITLLSWLVVFAMGFQAWLGATVVFSVLEPVKITIHMLMALLIVALLIYLIYSTKDPDKRPKFDRQTAQLLMLALGLTLVQVVLGTQVRQFVDEQAELLGEQAKNLWLSQPELQFYIHRSFSILVVGLNLWIAFRIYRQKLEFPKIYWVVFFLFLEIATGIAMNYFDFPFGSQPLHLLVASFLFGVQYYLVLEARNADKSLKTL